MKCWDGVVMAGQIGSGAFISVHFFGVNFQASVFSSVRGA